MNIRALRDLPTGLVWLTAALLLAVMFLLLLGSVREDSLTADEHAHITAGYAYLRFRDGRFNPEHPPLLKMLAAAPLLPLPLHFPRDHPAWQDGPNGVWDLMGVFLFESGHDLHRIAARARLAPIGLTVTLGLVLFLWARRWADDTSPGIRPWGRTKGGWPSHSPAGKLPEPYGRPTQRTPTHGSKGKCPWPGSGIPSWCMICATSNCLAHMP